MAATLTSAEAARRLGVKVSTIYAYVSRGLLTSERAEDGRSSVFALDEVERLARRARGSRQVESRLATVTTSVTEIGPDGPVYRGRRAVDLARSSHFEDVVDLLLDAPAGGSWLPAPLPRVPPGLAARDCLRWAVVMGGAADALRADSRPGQVAVATRRLIATMVECLGPDPGSASSPGSVAARLGRRLTGRPDPGPWSAIVDAALIVLADHELATSTLAARLAASTRADLYDAVLSALGVLGGPLHGGASSRAHALLRDAAARSAAEACNDALRWHGHLPGFGMALYPGGDPRAAALLDLLAAEADPTSWAVIGSVRALAGRDGVPPPNIDFALAALLFAAGMPPDGGETIFTVARVAGWAAHVIEERHEPALRFRVRAVHVHRRT